MKFWINNEILNTKMKFLEKSKFPMKSQNSGIDENFTENRNFPQKSNL